MEETHDMEALAIKPRARRKPLWLEWGEPVLSALVLTLILRSFLVQAFRIPTGSMEDTLLVGDFLFVNKLVYGAEIPFTDIHLPSIRSPRRGDVIVFEYPKDPSRDFIKRVVGIPGDVVQISNGHLTVNGESVEEPHAKYALSKRFPESYQQPNIYPDGGGNRDYFGPITVPQDQLFVLGDNRDQSDDSRFWGFVSREAVVGQALIVYMSFDEDGKARWDRVGKRIR